MTKVLDDLDKANKFLEECRRKGQQHRIHYSELASIALLIGINEKLEKLTTPVMLADPATKKKPRKLGPPLC